MTSKLSFYKMLKEEVKHHIVSVFVVVLYFLARLLFYYFEIQQVLNGSDRIEYLKSTINRSSGPEFEQMLLIIGLAGFLASEYFSYLHSKKKSDFYMSLPIRREDKFFMGAAMSSAIFFVPYVLEKIMESILAVSTGYVTGVYMENLFADVMCTTLVFVAAWLTMALAMIVTGHVVIAMLGFAAFCSYVPLFIKELLGVYQAIFFETYARQEMSNWWYYFSPVSLAAGLTEGYQSWVLKEHSDYLIAIIFFCVVLTVIVLEAYKKRPSEAAGRAMAFEKANPMVRFVLVIPLALFLGYILSCFAVGNVKAWIVLGTIIGSILFHGMIESIYRFDLRGMFSKKVQLAATIFICGCFISVFWWDMFGYDEYIPKENEVISIDMNLWADGIDLYSSVDAQHESEGITGEYVKVALALTENLISDMQGKVNEDDAVNVPGTVEVAQSASTVRGSWNNVGEVIFTYRLKNGSCRSRRYDIDLNSQENVALLDLIVGSEDYKEECYELYWVKSDAITELTLESCFESERVLFTPEEQEKFIEIYKNELNTLSYTKMNEYDKIARMVFEYNGTGREEWYIYNGFEETVKFLTEHGYQVKMPFEEYEILSLEIDAGYITSDAKEEMSSYIIRDSAFLESIKMELLAAELYNGEVYRVKNSEYGTVELSINGTRQFTSVLIRPETMKKIIEEIPE